MPMPGPEKGEEKSHYVSRCIATLTKNDPNREPKQVQAMCYETWDRKGMNQQKENKHNGS